MFVARVLWCYPQMRPSRRVVTADHGRRHRALLLATQKVPSAESKDRDISRFSPQIDRIFPASHYPAPRQLTAPGDTLLISACQFRFFNLSSPLILMYLFFLAYPFRARKYFKMA